MKKTIVTVILGLVYASLLAQIPNDLAFPSPNNKFLGASGKISAQSMVNVDLYTGTALVNVPIYNLKSKDLVIPISLNYTGGRGIKVQDYATSVGLGWQLIAGGSISRIVRCLPDEISTGYLGTGLWGKKLANAKTNQLPTPPEIMGLEDGSFGTPTADGESDLYSVKTPFFSIQFTFDGDGNPVFSNNTGLQIISTNFYNSSEYNNSSFEVIDSRGNQYYFGSSSLSKENSSQKLFDVNYDFTTTWYLDKIVSANSSDSISFQYLQSTQEEEFKHFQKVATIYGSCTAIDSTPVTTTILNPKYLSRIISIAGRIDLDYEFDRLDAGAKGRLNSISIKTYNGSLIDTYTFCSSYYRPISVAAISQRLRLDSVTISAGTIGPITLQSFSYNTANSLPSHSSDEFDYWGYYTLFTPINGSVDPLLHPALRKPNVLRTQANVLTTIKNLIGGIWNIKYELNTYYDNSSGVNFPVGGLRVKSLTRTLPQGSPMVTTYVYNDEMGRSTGQVLTKSYSNLVNYSEYGMIQVLSETHSNIYDLRGNFSGYSFVKVLDQNHGYTIQHFTNFSDFPDSIDYEGNSNTVYNFSSSISFAYKRGLPLDETVYTSTGEKISENLYSYTSLTNPISRTSWGFLWYTVFFQGCGGASQSIQVGSYYYTNIENYRLTQVIHKNYDQDNPLRYIQTTTNYTYTFDKRQIRSISNIDSEGNLHKQTMYYSIDTSNIPMITSTEETAITLMRNKNCTSVLIHTNDENNGRLHQVHNVYLSKPYGFEDKIYLDRTNYYTNSLLEKEQFFHYNLDTYRLISSNESNNSSTTVKYGYNSTLPVAKIVNAIDTIDYKNQVSNHTSTFYMPPNGLQAKNFSFITSTAGTITIKLPPGSYLGSNGQDGVTCLFSLSLTGPTTKSDDICNSSSPLYTCSDPTSISFTNMPAGVYTLRIYPFKNNSTIEVPVECTYPGYTVNSTVYTESFYEGFEEDVWATISNGHTGTAYWDGSLHSAYQVTFIAPNSRKYVIQWWSLSGNKWSMHEESYTGPRTITGKIDDVRIFPSDAQMTTYTYTPLVGKTGEISPDGRTITYEYDDLGRLIITRDDNQNIISKIDYQYANQP